MRNQLETSDISAFCFSQYVKLNIDKLCIELKIPQNKCPYIGDKFGYTGPNSPILALHSMIKHNQVQRGDYIIIWALGTGMQHIFMLLKY